MNLYVWGAYHGKANGDNLFYFQAGCEFAIAETEQQARDILKDNFMHRHNAEPVYNWLTTKPDVYPVNQPVSFIVYYE